MTKTTITPFSRGSTYSYSTSTVSTSSSTSTLIYGVSYDESYYHSAYRPGKNYHEDEWDEAVAFFKNACGVMKKYLLIFFYAIFNHKHYSELTGYKKKE